MKLCKTECGENQIKSLKSLLTMYRLFIHDVNTQPEDTDELLIVESHRHISDIISGVISFKSEESESMFYGKVLCLDTTPELLNLLDETLVILKDYPDGGNMFYQLLERLYFDNFSYSNEEVMEDLDLPRTTYYRYLKHAHGRYCYEFIRVLRREIKLLDGISERT